MPRAFQIDDPVVIAQFIELNGFATIVSNDGASPLQSSSALSAELATPTPFATHAPVMLRGTAGLGGVLRFHLARANPQWHHFQAGSEVLVIFTGPHAYVSPSWYHSSPNVPTWNYTAVHVYGRARVIEDHAEMVQLLSELVIKYESTRQSPWAYDVPDDYRDRLIEAIVGIEVQITRVQAKFKLSQNRAQEIDNVCQALLSSPYDGDRQLGQFMREQLSD